MSISEKAKHAAERIACSYEGGNATIAKDFARREIQRAINSALSDAQKTIEYLRADHKCLCRAYGEKREEVEQLQRELKAAREAWFIFKQVDEERETVLGKIEQIEGYTLPEGRRIRQTYRDVRVRYFKSIAVIESILSARATETKA